MKSNAKGITFLRNLTDLDGRRCGMIILGNIILAFGLYEVHAQTRVTEGGVLGAILLLKHWLNISPAYSGFVLDVLCFAFGWKVLGTGFLGYSIVATTTFSVVYRIVEAFPPLWPRLVESPFAAALIGAVFVGVGVGLSVRAGAACGGDDALVMALHKLTGRSLTFWYLITDMVVLVLSLTYIPLERIAWSMLTAFLSGQIIGWLQRVRPRKRRSVA